MKQRSGVDINGTLCQVSVDPQLPEKKRPWWMKHGFSTPPLPPDPKGSQRPFTPGGCGATTDGGQPTCNLTCREGFHLRCRWSGSCAIDSSCDSQLGNAYEQSADRRCGATRAGKRLELNDVNKVGDQLGQEPYCCTCSPGSAYTVIMDGTCESYGYHGITSIQTCHAAGVWLSGDQSTEFAPDMPRPHGYPTVTDAVPAGCQVLKGDLDNHPLQLWPHAYGTCGSADMACICVVPWHLMDHLDSNVHPCLREKRVVDHTRQCTKRPAVITTYPSVTNSSNSTNSTNSTNSANASSIPAAISSPIQAETIIREVWRSTSLGVSFSFFLRNADYAALTGNMQMLLRLEDAMKRIISKHVKLAEVREENLKIVYIPDVVMKVNVTVAPWECCGDEHNRAFRRLRGSLSLAAEIEDSVADTVGMDRPFYTTGDVRVTDLSSMVMVNSTGMGLGLTYIPPVQPSSGEGGARSTRAPNASAINSTVKHAVNITENATNHSRGNTTSNKTMNVTFPIRYPLHRGRIHHKEVESKAKTLVKSMHLAPDKKPIRLTTAPPEHQEGLKRKNSTVLEPIRKANGSKKKQRDSSLDALIVLLSFLAVGAWINFFVRRRRLMALSFPNSGVEPFPTCPQGHSLRLFQASGGACDGCGTQVQEGENVLDCRTCDWFLCQACLPQSEAARCPQGHELLPNVPGAGACDGCGTQMGPEDMVLDCRRCDWFVCQKCLPPGGVGPSAEAAPPSAEAPAAEEKVEEARAKVEDVAAPVEGGDAEAPAATGETPPAEQEEAMPGDGAPVAQ